MRPLLVDRDRRRRHEVAAAILAAFTGDAGLAALRRSVDAASRGTPQADRLRAGFAAATAYREAAGPPSTSLAAGLRATTSLLRAGLFFEAHERLEEEWRALAGRRRGALQGIIQLVVALHHLAHGNARGARTLFDKGRAHLEQDGEALEEIDPRAVLAVFARWERAFRAGRWPERLAPPVLVLREHAASAGAVSSPRARRPSG